MEKTKPLPYVYSRLGDDPELAEIVDLFVDEIPQRASVLLRQLHEKDWEALRRTAHQLKGAAGSYGFEPVSPCAARVEAAIRDGLPEEQIRHSVMELVDICGRLRGSRKI
ncbi:MAG: Hpt domain-containing protein [Planctomycetaceae bacterium]|nr:Hpt domain-containing protein [Planctomycetaceae bacterium]